MLSPYTKRLLLAQSDPIAALLSFMKDMEEKVDGMEKRVTEKCLAEMKNMPVGKMLENIASVKGDKGDMPIAGTDYPLPENGKTPIKGRDYFTPQEIQNFISHIQSKIVIPEVKDGVSPVAGVDYPDFVQVQEILQVELRKLPKYDEAAVFQKIKTAFPKIEVKGEDIVREINQLPIQPEFQIDAKHIKNLPKAQRRGKLGGGSGGGNVTELAATGAVDGTNVAFTFSQKPDYILSDGAKYK